MVTRMLRRSIGIVVVVAVLNDFNPALFLVGSVLRKSDFLLLDDVVVIAYTVAVVVRI